MRVTTHSIRAVLPILLLLAIIQSVVTACSSTGSDAEMLVPQNGPPQGAKEIPMDYAETFQVYERNGYRIVDLSAPIVSWGGTAQGGERSARIVLVPKEKEPPALTGDLEDAVVVRTPVERIATNYGFQEALLIALDIEERLVAVGGVKSYNDAIRARTKSGELAQLGYSWHSPPSIDPLLESEPDVFLMILGGLGHAVHYDRIKELGVPVVPIFFKAESSYLGPVDYVRLIGMMAGKEAEADAFVSMVATKVSELKSLVAEVEPRTILNSYYAGDGRWAVFVRNADNAFMEDAGGTNPMAEPDDIRLDDFSRVGTEVLLEKARDVDCWIIRDVHSAPFDDTSVLQNFKAWRDGCLFASDGMTKPEADAYDFYEMALIRPDLILGDMVRILHPELRDAPFVYYRPDAQMAQP